MAVASQYQVPGTPRVTSPSPTPSQQSDRDGYFPPATRSNIANRRPSPEPIAEQDVDSSGSDPDLKRARSRSRSPQLKRHPAGHPNGIPTAPKTSTPSAAASKPTRRKKVSATTQSPPSDAANAYLSPRSATNGYGSAYWRQLSRSPSPLGLIPIHRDWRVFVHKHEIPRKALHVSIGFVTLALYLSGVQQTAIHPLTLSLLVPIAGLDVLRFRWPQLNRLYIRVMGAFMRESEAHDRFNGVIFYIAGLWVVLRFCRKDVAVVSVLLLSWCDAAASTFGRLWGRYTPRIRRGKSVAGSLACFVVGVGSAALFWGLIAPRVDAAFNRDDNAFAFTGHLSLPARVRDTLGLTPAQAMVSGAPALAVLSLITGLIASVSEAIDLWDLDDNLTIPALCGAGLGALLWACG